MSRTFRAMALGLVLMLMPTAAMAVPQVYGLVVDGLACPFCAYRLEKQLGTIDGVERVEIDVETGRVAVTMADGTTLDEAEARKVIEEAGFTLREFDGAQAKQE